MLKSFRVLYPTLLRCLSSRISASSCTANARHYSENSAAKYALLGHRSLIEMRGRDASDFLQGLVTNDVNLLPEMKCMYAMMLNQHGRVVNDLILYRQDEDEEAILVECESELVESFLKTLRLYKLRKKVSISFKDNLSVVQAFIEGDMGVDEELWPPADINTVSSMIDPRLSMLGYRMVAEDLNDENKLIFCDTDDYNQFRIRHGIPEGVTDLPPTKCLPLECNLDYMNGVSFHKGCYIGQELTARTKFTGVIRKRLVPVEISGVEPIAADTSLYTAKGKSAGKFRSSFQNKLGLALVRLNYVGETLETKEGHKLKCHIPTWWPYKDGSEFSDGVCGPNMDAQ